MDKKYLLFMIPLVALASTLGGCGGEGEDSIEADSKDFATVACGPENAGEGDAVTCTVDGGFKPDCTVFVGSTPVDAAFKSEKETISFTLPSVSADRVEISYQCGSRPARTLQKDFAVHHRSEPACEGGRCAPSPDANAAPQTPCSAGSGCPSVPEGVGTEPAGEGEEDEVIVPDEADPPPAPPAPPAQPPPAPPPPRPEPLEVSFIRGAGHTEALNETKLGLVRIEWDIRGGGDLREAFIRGPFNRKGSHEGCGIVNGRYLAVKSDGSDFEGNEPNFLRDRLYMTGQVCTSHNCRGFNERSGGPAICKIDLKEIGDHGVFYTRSFERNGRFVLVAQAQDGRWAEEASIEVEAPAPELTCEFREFLRNEETFTVSVSGSYLETVSIRGCSPSGELRDGWTQHGNRIEASPRNGRVDAVLTCVTPDEPTTVFCNAIGLGEMRRSKSFDVTPTPRPDNPPPSRAPVPEAHQSKRVVGLKLLIQTGNIPDAGTDTGGKFLFDLCPTQDMDNGRNCFRARFNDASPNELTLDGSAHEAIDFGRSSRIVDARRKQMSELRYPDDFKFFRIAPDPEDGVHDAWFLQGVELQVKLEGEGRFKAVYRNPCVGRWIESEGRNLYSPHSIENDDAFCLYVETGEGDDAGTDDSVRALIPMNDGQNLDPAALSWMRDYQSAGETPMVLYDGSTNHLEIPLQYGEMDDFGDNNNDQHGDSYTFTVYNGRHRMAESRIKLEIGGGDGMLLHRFRAYYFRPGDSDFIATGKCRVEEGIPDQWLDMDDPHSPDWPASDYMGLDETECPKLKDIRIDPCDFAYGVHTQEWPGLDCGY